MPRLLRYIHRHVSRYAPVDVPCRRTQIRRNLVELFLAVTLERINGLKKEGIMAHNPNTLQECIFCFEVNLNLYF
jgi:hypothetical protein